MASGSTPSNPPDKVLLMMDKVRFTFYEMSKKKITVKRKSMRMKNNIK